MENSQTPKFNQIYESQTSVMKFIINLLTKNISLDETEINLLKIYTDLLVVKDPTNEFYYILLKEIKKIKPVSKIITSESNTEIINNIIELPKEERRVVEIKPEVEPDTTPIKKVKQTKTKKEDNEIDIKIKKLEAKNTKGSYCGADIEEIERLYKLKNRDREDKFKKNWKNGKIVETIEQ